jgi:hypothetical protein
MSAGRQMGPFATHSLNEDGSWKDLNKKKFQRRYFSYRRTNAKIIRTCAGIKIYRQVKGIPNKSNFSVEGNEIAWGTIGNASTGIVF